jgi:hypothetical protein
VVVKVLALLELQEAQVDQAEELEIVQAELLLEVLVQQTKAMLEDLILVMVLVQMDQVVAEQVLLDLLMLVALQTILMFLVEMELHLVLLAPQLQEVLEDRVEAAMMGKMDLTEPQTMVMAVVVLLVVLLQLLVEMVDLELL